ncbi:3'-5' exonuclease [Mycolicibacterium aichiense]|uniref:3'-5' exonuclease n=1 Tax=Mycolicibacterium aichiense TaxID=1799 RepID=UPI003D672713
MDDVTGATVVSMAPTGGDDVVQQLNTAASRVLVGWPAMALTLLFGLFTIPWGLLSWIVLVPACIWLILWDQSRHKVVLFYDVNDEPAQWFTKVVEQWQWLSQSQALWRVIQSGAVRTTYQFKTNSGASNVVNRVRAVANSSGPQQLATNIAVPTISAGRTSLHFLPDRVLVREGKRFSDIAYTHLGIDPGSTRFIEESAPPGDAIQVDWTWRFVNVKGGPDRRYNNNRQLPVMHYETLDFTSPQGLQWHLQISRNGAATPVAAVLSLHDRVLTVAPPSPPARQPVTPQRPASKPQPAPAEAPDRKQAPQMNVAFELVPATPQAAPAAQSRGFTEAQLTRNKTPHPATEITYTAIDLETTGLDPITDRIVEIGLVKFTADGTVVDEFATLVNNPGSSDQARSVHGIEDTDLAGAPTTAQALSEALAFMSGTVLVAHNLEFEDGFLTSAARKAGMQLPHVLSICTLRTSRRQLDGRAFSLKAMYKTATGEWLDRNHTALADARAVKDVLLWLLRTAPQPLYLTAVSSSTPTQIGTQCAIKCRPVPLTRSSVAALLDSFPQSPNPRTGDSAAIGRYKDVLAEAVEDGRLTYEEADTLTRQACLTRLTGPQLRALHRQAWELAFPEDKDDDWTSLTPTKRREMYLLAEALGLDDLTETLNQVITACAEPEPPVHARYLRGLRVAIVGDHFEVVELREYAESYGAKLAVNITKTVLWMASVTPDANDSRHETARRLGIPIISPAQGRERLDESVREAELKAFERQRLIDESNAQRRRYEAEADAYWRPQWRDRELDHDPEPEYESW